MRLISFQVTNFRSVEDSGVIDAGRLVCLVGKNEAGKTALLHALAGLHPHPGTPIVFDKERDYPRRYLTAYKQRHPEKEAVIVSTHWRIDDDEYEEISRRIGPHSLSSRIVNVSRRYEASQAEWSFPIRYESVILFLIEKWQLSDEEKAPLASATITDELRAALQSLENRSEKQEALLRDILELPGTNAIGYVSSCLKRKLPYFMYFSHYDRMAGQMRVDDLVEKGDRYVRVRQNTTYNVHRQPVVENIEDDLPTGEMVFLDFLRFAGTTIDEIKDSQTYESLNAKCEAASNTITDQLREYWTQNPFLEIDVRLTKAEPKDPAPFNDGIIARARVRNTIHRVSVPFSERSAGFIWFFSFLVKFAQVRRDGGALFILLDEPGLTLHGKAQADLLRYFNDHLIPHHQVIFSTHSPFMVPVEDLLQSRIVEDQITQKRPGFWETRGTKVTSDILSVDHDTLFPLQGALGYDITQALFVGKHTLLVEGPGDILFFHALSAQLKKRKREFLNPSWVICPTGGIDKIQTFVALFHGANLEMAVMTDFSAGDKKKLENLKKSGLLNAGRVMNFAETLQLQEADVEDIFSTQIYINLVNEAFGLKGSTKITIAKLDSALPQPARQVKRMEAAFKLLPATVPEFDHFTPADWLVRNPSFLDGPDKEIEETLGRAELIFASINKHL